MDKFIEDFSPEQIVLIKATIYDALYEKLQKENFLLLTEIAGNCPFLQAHGSASFIKNFES